MKNFWAKAIGLLIIAAIIFNNFGTFLILAILGIGIYALYTLFKQRKAKPDGEVIEEAAAPKLSETVSDDSEDRFVSEDKFVFDKYQPYLPKVGNKHKIVGLQYRQKNVLKLATINPDYSLTKDEIIAKKMIDTRIHKYIFTNEPVTLEQEPTNEVDPNAIKVVVAGQHIGYIKAGSCARVNKLINEDRIEQILCRISGGPFKGVYAEIEYDSGKEELIYEQETDDLAAEIRIIAKK